MVAEALNAAGHEARHVVELGLYKADDIEILELAAQEKAIIITQDTDYGTLLASRPQSSPSVILFRMRDGRPSSQIAFLLQNLSGIAEALESGAIVVFSDQALRIRLSPILGSEQ